MNRTQTMITPEIRADLINILIKQSPPEIRDSWMTDRFMHNTFVSHLVPGVGIDVKEIIGKTDCEVNALIRQRMSTHVRKERNMIEPLRNNVIIEPMDESKLPPSHITLPHRARDDDRFGWVRFIGPDVKVLKPGDGVILPTWNDDELEVDGKKYIVLAEKAISVRIPE